MSYVKNTWTEGDVITADKLNNIEEGIDSLGKILIIDDIPFSIFSSGNPYEKTITAEEYNEYIKYDRIKLSFYEEMIGASEFILFKSVKEGTENNSSIAFFSITDSPVLGLSFHKDDDSFKLTLHIMTSST